MIAKVLGPLRVTVNDVSVVPTALKARKLLALLILNRGRVTQVGTIERELWGADAPMSAPTGIQNCVMQIRKGIDRALGGFPDRPAKQLLVTEPTGYRLEIQDEQFDVSRYRNLVAAADDIERRGDLAQASAQLSGALNLWRDAPLADVPSGPVLRSHVLLLEEDRRSVLRRRISLDLRLHRYSQVIGELRALTALNPYDEMLHEQLMRALHLTGRRGDALAVYRGIRTAMVDGIGLEPSPRLHRLQQAILRADDSLGPDGHPRPVSAVPAQRRLPPAGHLALSEPRHGSA